MHVVLAFTDHLRLIQHAFHVHLDTLEQPLAPRPQSLRARFVLRVGKARATVVGRVDVLPVRKVHTAPLYLVIVTHAPHVRQGTAPQAQALLERMLELAQYVHRVTVARV